MPLPNGQSGTLGKAGLLGPDDGELWATTNLGFADAALPGAPAIGLPISGEFEPVGIYRSKPINAEVTIGGLLQATPSWHDELEATRQRPATMEAVVAKSKRSRILEPLGLVCRNATWPLGMAPRLASSREIRSFAAELHIQRAINNDKSSNHNLATKYGNNPHDLY